MPDKLEPMTKRDAAGPKAVPAGGAPARSGGTFDYKAILQHMVQQNASDVHLKVGRPPSLRVDGQMVSLEMPPLTQEDLRSLAEQIMAPKNIKEFSEQKESDFALAVPGVGRFRVNAYQQRGTIAYAMRTVPFQAKTVAELNLPEVCERISLLPRGLVLVTGITGSGKSTALASMLHYINQNRHANIITIEDPIEFLHRDIKSSINQREVGTDTNSFNQALRRVLRQDPDILLVGEIRDMETLDTALKAAETGHLVFSTLHTTDATQTINRVLSFYPPHQQTEELVPQGRDLLRRRIVRLDQPGRVLSPRAGDRGVQRYFVGYRQTGSYLTERDAICPLLTATERAGVVSDRDVSSQFTTPGLISVAFRGRTSTRFSNPCSILRTSMV